MARQGSQSVWRGDCGRWRLEQIAGGMGFIYRMVYEFCLLQVNLFSDGYFTKAVTI
jgi:hypothetical protein